LRVARGNHAAVGGRGAQLAHGVQLASHWIRIGARLLEATNCLHRHCARHVSEASSVVAAVETTHRRAGRWSGNPGTLRAQRTEAPLPNGNSLRFLRGPVGVALRVTEVGITAVDDDTWVQRRRVPHPHRAGRARETLGTDPARHGAAQTGHQRILKLARRDGRELTLHAEERTGLAACLGRSVVDLLRRYELRHLRGRWDEDRSNGLQGLAQKGPREAAGEAIAARGDKSDGLQGSLERGTIAGTDNSQQTTLGGVGRGEGWVQGLEEDEGVTNVEVLRDGDRETIRARCHLRCCGGEDGLWLAAGDVELLTSSDASLELRHADVRIAGSGEWLQQGVATLLEAQRHSQVADIVARGIGQAVGLAGRRDAGRLGHVAGAERLA